MAMASGGKQWTVQFYLGPLVGVLVFLFTFTGAYERAELVTYDWRFNVRNTLFGVPPMHPDLGTIDIDLKSLDTEGRYQDWTRDKYTEVVQLLSRYGARLVGFDVFFIEPSTRLISEAQIRQLGRIDAESIEGLLSRADHDERFRQAIAAAGNVYLAQTIVVPHSEIGAAAAEPRLEPRSDDDDGALAWIRANSPRLMVDPAASTLWRGFQFDPPLRSLREAARGFAYAQTVTDVDGARRRYPFVYQYEDIVFPSMALAMAADYLQVPIAAVKVWPGDCVLLPAARFSDGSMRDIRVPIDRFGNMDVNWAGRWDETFVHYPHVALRDAAQREERQLLLEELKRQAAADPELQRNPRGMPAAMARAGYADMPAVVAGLRTWSRAVDIEAAVTRNPELTADQFWKAKGLSDPGRAQNLLVDQVRAANRVAALLAADPGRDEAGLLAALPTEEPGLVRQCARYVRGVLVDGAVPAAARPLVFYPYLEYQPRAGEEALLTPEDMAGKVLFYGLTAPGTTDLSVTPVQGSYPMVGIYPNVLNTILQGTFIRRTPAWVDALLVVAIGVGLSLAVPRLKVLAGAVLVGLLMLVYGLLALFAFTHFAVWLELVGPLLALVVGYLGLTIYGYIMKEKEKEFVQGAFGHYLAPAVVDQIMNNPDMINQLGGEERVMSSFFSDIASFSTISECLTPAELVRFINDYLSDMCEVIEQYGGTIDKFEGDAILAFFGAPLYFADHSVKGCLACIDQQRHLAELRQRWDHDRSLPAALQALRERWEAEGRTFAHVRMGLTSGPMVVGNMGSRARTDYTMMGDTVNLAARFESGQKIYGTGIMVNEVVYAAVADLAETRRLDLIQVVGKEEPVAAYEVLERKGELPAAKCEVLDLYNQGLEQYERFEFDAARRLFLRALEIDPRDGPSALYADRCEDYAVQRPADLVFRARSK
ncbi:MAG: CHASE2 domain-containing protein [Gemmatimonadota bacterium]